MQHNARFSRRVATAATATLLALASLAVLPSAAGAQESPPVARCNSGTFCLWVNPYYAGGRFASYGSDSNLFNNTFAGTGTVVANHSSSLKNAGTEQAYDGVRIYYNLYTSTPNRCLPRGTAYANLANVSAGSGRTWNDNIVRYSWTTAC